MKKIVIGVFAVFASAAAFAQESNVTGKYTGNWTGEAGNRRSAVLTIQKVEGDSVSGVLERFAHSARGTRKRPCDGEYPVAGTLKGNELDLRTTEPGGRAGDCSTHIKAAIQGNKLVGTIGPNHVEFSK